MTDCGCEKAKAELEEYLRNELCTEDAADIREHLEHCDGCSSAAHLNVVLTEVVQRIQIPELQGELLAAIDAELIGVEA